MRHLSNHIGGSGGFGDMGATVRTGLAAPVIGKPLAEAAVAIGVPARYDVWLVEQATAYFAGDMGPQAVEIGL